MNKMLKYAEILLPHVLIIGSIFLGTLWILDELNPMMDFLSNPTAKTVLFLFCLTGLFQGISVFRRWDKED